jgi:hypothetical protein
MRRFIQLVLLLLILAPLALAGLLLASLSDQPAVSRAVDLSPESLARGQRILDENDPRKLRSGQVKTTQLTEGELDLAANYLAHRYAHGSARLTLESNAARLAFSASLPPPLAGRYLNGEALMLPAETGLPRFERLRLGNVDLPGWLANTVMDRTLAQYQGGEAQQALNQAVQRVKIADGKLTLVYQWQSDLPARLSGAVLPEADLERMRAFQQRLIETGRGVKQKEVSLAELLPPLLGLAKERAAAGGDAVAENRAALIALSFYINQKGLNNVVPGAEKWPKEALRRVKLNGRDDFPKHFSLSAAIAVAADTPLSDAIGLYKEVKDSRGGSGFSFNDIAADRAGTRMGEMAVASPDAALFLLQRVGPGLRETDFMPSTEGLPEFMPEAEFKQRFGGIGEPKYVQMMANIEGRIAGLPLYRR